MTISSKWRNLSFEKKLSIVIVPVLLAVLTGVVIPRVNHALTPGPAPRLLARDVVPRDGSLVPDIAPQVEATLYNGGTQRSVIKRAVVTIKGSLLLDVCAAEGDIAITGQYDVRLPVRPRLGQLLEVPVSQQLAPDEADRFVLKFQFNAQELDLVAEGLSIFYQLELALIHDNDQRLELGEVIIAVPTTPPASWATFNEEEFNQGANYSPTFGACVRDKRAQAATFLKRAGKRSEQLRALTETLSTHPPSPRPEPTTTTAVELAGQGQAVASETAPDSVDAAGNRITYAASNVLDGNPETAWRVPGDGVGATLTITFPHKIFVYEAGLLPGYAKKDPQTGADRFLENGRVTSVTWRFDTGDEGLRDQSVEDRPEVQVQSVNYKGTRSIILTITGSNPGTKSPRYTAISEISLRGFVLPG